MRMLSNRALLGAGAIGAAVVLAGCGGGSKPAASTGAPTGTSQMHADPSTHFSTATVSGLGKVVVDGKGRTVYVLTTGDHTNTPCTDASGCTKVWPDLPLPSATSKPTAGMGAQASLLKTMKLSDGETYPTYNGWLMYEYTGDSGPGQGHGEGIKSFGGTWYALDASGNLVKSGSGGSGGGGGGY